MMAGFLDEIADCVGLIDPATETIGFTGGEPLLNWQRFIAVLTAVREKRLLARMRQLCGAVTLCRLLFPSGRPRMSRGIRAISAAEAQSISRRKRR